MILERREGRSGGRGRREGRRRESRIDVHEKARELEKLN